MSMKIIEYDENKHRNIWIDFVENHPKSTIYHTREWAEVLKNTFLFKEKSLLCFSAENKLIALLPLWQVNRNTYVNSPWRDRADILFNDLQGKEHLINKLTEIDYDLILKDWNYDLPSKDFYLVNYWITSVLDIKGKKNEFLNNVYRSCGKNIRKAEKSGVKIDKTLTVENMYKFYGLFKKTRKRLGVPIYPWNLFQNIFNSFNNGKIRLYLGFMENVAINGAIIFDSHKQSIYAYGAFDYEYQDTRANDILFWQIISDSIEMGMDSFDFGADSPSQVGLLRFKQKWLTEQKILCTLYKTKNKIDPIKSDFSSNKYAIHRKIFSKLPEWLLVFIGDILVKRNG